MSAVAILSPELDPFLQARFLAIVPCIELHGRVYFRHLKSAEKKEDCIAEMIGLCWKWFLSLHERGKDGTEFPGALASFAARHVRSGRKVCGQDKARDVLSGIAQQRHGFTGSPLPDGSSLNGNVFDEALHDNTQTPVPEQVCFRLDFPVFRLTHSDRSRHILDDLMMSERSLDVARKYGTTPGRISQMRQEFYLGWNRFCADPGQTGPTALAYTQRLPAFPPSFFPHPFLHGTARSPHPAGRCRASFPWN